MSECNHEKQFCWCQMDKVAWDTEQRMKPENERLREALRQIAQRTDEDVHEEVYDYGSGSAGAIYEVHQMALAALNRTT